MDFLKELEGLVVASLKKLGIDGAEDLAVIEVPGDAENGDYAFPCFRLAKQLRKAPAVIAAELNDLLEKPEFLREIKTAGGYVNFYLDKGSFIKEVINNVLAAGTEYGRSRLGNGKTIVIDYSSPNIAKPFHPGHLRTTLIGAAIYNLHKYIGYNCVGINYLGDWGTQFGKMITAYKLWGDDAAIDEKGIDELTRLYVKFHDEAEHDPSLNDAARNWLLRMQNGDGDALAIWRRFFNISMADFERIYRKLGVTFDYYRGESYYNDKMGAVIDELREKNLLVESEGAMVVDLSEYNMPPCLILRSDGGTLYPTRDIAAALDRKRTFGFYKSLYVTGLEQNLHFAQWMKVMEKMGYDWAADMEHISYGMVIFEAGKLSTRKGNVIKMEDLLDEAAAKTLAIIEEKNPELPDKRTVAMQVGIGAIKFNDMFNGRIKDVDFSWGRLLNFEGETGPYVQYAHARACSVLRKAAEISAYPECGEAGDAAAMETTRLIYDFPARIIEAANKREPYIISRTMIKLAQCFNTFYHENPILTADHSIRAGRLALCEAVRTVLSIGLGLLGIEAPERM